MASKTVSPIKIVNNQIISKNNEDKNKNKRNLSTSSTPPQSPSYSACIKKAKSFVTPNRFSVLSVDEPTIENSITPDNQNQEQPNTTNNTPKTILPPPIFIKGVLNYIGLLDQFKQIIGPNTFSCKSTSTHLKIQTDTPDNYRKIIHLLKEINAQYHTFQLQSDKPLRVVIRNLHPSTPESDITTALEEIGHTVRNVINVKHHQTKMSLPMFFVDIDPNESDSDIFSITSILHTKVKIEEPHKKRQIPQCQNCQSYGHTRSYCAYPPICVKCGENHPSSTCIKPPDVPAKCGLCQGAHPANYKGCTIYQSISRKHNNNTSSKKAHQPPPPSHNNTANPEYQQQQPSPDNTPRSRTYANVTEGHQSPNLNTHKNSNEISLLKFLDEFKSIISPLISLLTTVLSNLINTINAK